MNEDDKNVRNKDDGVKSGVIGYEASYQGGMRVHEKEALPKHPVKLSRTRLVTSHYERIRRIQQVGRTRVLEESPGGGLFF